MRRPSRCADSTWCTGRASRLIDLELLSRQFAESHLPVEVAARAGVRLTPSRAHLEALESQLAASWGRAGAAATVPNWQPTGDDEAYILAGGAFLGEAVIASYGGVWECNPYTPDDARLFRVICEDRVAVWPMTLVYLRLKCGAAYDLAEFMTRIGRALDDASAV